MGLHAVQRGIYVGSQSSLMSSKIIMRSLVFVERSGERLNSDLCLVNIFIKLGLTMMNE